MLRLNKLIVGFVALSSVTLLPLSISAASTGTIGYIYDLNGRLQTVNMSDSATISFVYDKGDNRLSRISKNSFISAIYALQVLSGSSPTEQTVADINGDGQVGLAEAISLLRKVAGDAK